MAILQNARRERVAQNLAKGMSADASHTAAGYKPNRKNAARMKSYEDIRGRVAELQGSTAKQITDVRDAARQHTLAAVETLVSVMKDRKAPHSARVAAANGILDRGYGKAVRRCAPARPPFRGQPLTMRGHAIPWATLGTDARIRSGRSQAGAPFRPS